MGVAVDRLTDDLTIETLGLDSLTLAEIVIAIEHRLGCSIDTTQIAQVDAKTTLGSLLDAVVAAAQPETETAEPTA